MNILVTTQHGEVAGATYSIFYLAKGLSEKGHKVILALRFGTLLYQLATESGILCENIHFNRKLDLSIWRKIDDLTKRYRIEVVYAQESKDRYACIFSRMFYKGKYKLFLARRQKVVDPNFFKRYLYSSHTDGQIVVSHGLKNEMLKLRFPEREMKVIHNGLPQICYTENHELLNQLKEKYKIASNDVIIGCVARPKRQDDLLAVIKRLPENYKLLLIGISIEQLKYFFASLDINQLMNRIIMPGLITESAILYHHYKLMHVHVLSSDMDGFGMVTLEAMQLGIPVIGANYGGIPDVIENSISGFIYELGNITQLKNQILKITTDEKLRRQFVDESIKRASHFSIEETVRKYELYFESVIND